MYIYIWMKFLQTKYSKLTFYNLGFVPYLKYQLFMLHCTTVKRVKNILKNISLTLWNYLHNVLLARQQPKSPPSIDIKTKFTWWTTHLFSKENKLTFFFEKIRTKMSHYTDGEDTVIWCEKNSLNKLLLRVCNQLVYWIIWIKELYDTVLWYG